MTPEPDADVDALLARLRDAGVELDGPVPLPEAGPATGTPCTNVLLRQKRAFGAIAPASRLLVIRSADSPSKIDLGDLARRLGLTACTLALETTSKLRREWGLQLPRDGVTPLCLHRGPRDHPCTVVLERTLLAAPRLLFHPLRADRVVALTPAALRAWCASCGCPVLVDDGTGALPLAQALALASGDAAALAGVDNGGAAAGGGTACATTAAASTATEPTSPRPGVEPDIVAGVAVPWRTALVVPAAGHPGAGVPQDLTGVSQEPGLGAPQDRTALLVECVERTLGGDDSGFEASLCALRGLVDELIAADGVTHQMAAPAPPDGGNDGGGTADNPWLSTRLRGQQQEGQDGCGATVDQPPLPPHDQEQEWEQGPKQEQGQDRGPKQEPEQEPEQEPGQEPAQERGQGPEQAQAQEQGQGPKQEDQAQGQDQEGRGQEVAGNPALALLAVMQRWDTRRHASCDCHDFQACSHAKSCAHARFLRISHRLLYLTTQRQRAESLALTQKAMEWWDADHGIDLHLAKPMRLSSRDVVLLCRRYAFTSEELGGRTFVLRYACGLLTRLGRHPMEELSLADMFLKNKAEFTPFREACRHIVTRTMLVAAGTEAPGLWDARIPTATVLRMLLLCRFSKPELGEEAIDGYAAALATQRHRNRHALAELGRLGLTAPPEARATSTATATSTTRPQGQAGATSTTSTTSTTARGHTNAPAVAGGAGGGGAEDVAWACALVDTTAGDDATCRSKRLPHVRTLARLLSAFEGEPTALAALPRAHVYRLISQMLDRPRQYMHLAVGLLALLPAPRATDPAHREALGQLQLDILEAVSVLSQHDRRQADRHAIALASATHTQHWTVAARVLQGKRVSRTDVLALEQWAVWQQWTADKPTFQSAASSDQGSSSTQRSTGLDSGSGGGSGSSGKHQHLPRIELPPDSPRIHVVQDLEGVESAMRVLEGCASAGAAEEGPVLVGLDAEWRPHCADRVALLQVATATDVFLIDLLALVPRNPDPSQPEPGPATATAKLISNLFLSDRYLKLGFDFVGNDLPNLLDTFPRFAGAWGCVRGIVDVADLDEAAGRGAPQRPSRRRPRRGLADICADVLGRRLDKTCQMSDWGARPLTAAQVQYAAIDAHVLLDLFHAFAPHPGPGHAQDRDQEADIEFEVSGAGGEAAAAAAAPAQSWWQRYSQDRPTPTPPGPTGSGNDQAK